MRVDVYVPRPVSVPCRTRTPAAKQHTVSCDSLPVSDTAGVAIHERSTLDCSGHASKCWQVLASAGKCNGYADELAQLQNDKAADTDNQSLLRYSSTVRLN